eukprot:13440217-Alexandrium_andersonii.AAC.1
MPGHTHAQKRNRGARRKMSGARADAHAYARRALCDQRIHESTHGARAHAGEANETTTARAMHKYRNHAAQSIGFAFPAC